MFLWNFLRDAFGDLTHESWWKSVVVGLVLASALAYFLFPHL